jgi:hypothetical protein
VARGVCWSRRWGGKWPGVCAGSRWGSKWPGVYAGLDGVASGQGCVLCLGGVASGQGCVLGLGGGVASGQGCVLGLGGVKLHRKRKAAPPHHLPRGENAICNSHSLPAGLSQVSNPLYPHPSHPTTPDPHTLALPHLCPANVMIVAEMWIV